MITYTIARTNEPRFNVPTAQWVCSECGAVVEHQERHDAFHARLDRVFRATDLPGGERPAD